jgi:extracellular factor (EF) 3-hydroxypalmitic acid methyl ester biosynthesis protein
MLLKRDLRYAVEAHDVGISIRFLDFQKTEHTCKVKDYSRTGVSFYLDDGSLLLKIGDIIPDLRFYYLNQEVHSSSATIIHIQDEDKGGQAVSCIGCSYNDQSMDIYSIMRADKITKLQNDFLDFVQTMAIEENLDPEFVNLTSHIHYIFDGFQERLSKDREDIRLEDESIKGSLLETLRELAFEALFGELDRYYDHFTKIVNRFSDPKQHYIHREYFQKCLITYLSKSKLFKRSSTKPLGYAGDYEMINIIHRNSFEGDDLFSQVLNKIDCETTAARAVRNRRTYLYKKMRNLLISNVDGKDVKIMSVVCGPAFEFSDLIKGYEGKETAFNLEFIAMDQDILALEDAKARIDPLVKHNPHIRVHFEQDNIKRLIVEKTTSKNIYADMDFIYSPGLFDYLSDRASNRLIHKLYSFLKPGGLLVIGNFGMYNPQRFIMEYGAEWFLIHRGEYELKALVADLPGNPSLLVEKEPEGVNLFLNIQKPKDS